MSNIYGLIGKKLSHSFSPEIHKLILNKLDIKGTYNLFEIKEENLKAAVHGLNALEVKGVNVTIPYKIDIMQYLDDISEEAAKIGAINTISFKDEILKGYNTDYIGFGASLIHSGIEIKNKTVLILGTGGASKAVVQYLVDNGARDIVYVSRDKKKAALNTENFRIISYEELENLKFMDLIINCTPCGMYPITDNCPVNEKVIDKFSTAIDLIYNPEKTIFLKLAENKGLKVVNGLYMLVAQAIASQEIWQEAYFDDEFVHDIYNMTKSIIFR